METNTSRGIELQNKRLGNDIRTMFERVKSPLSTKCRIYRVPYYLRKLNEEAYTPQVISIGPIHHGKERFQTMEKHKVIYFNSFLVRANINNLEHLISTFRAMEESIRCCYVETIQPINDDFLKMIMVDASFILELFLGYHYKIMESEDPMLVEAWLSSVVWHDLLLLENQLPFFVIKKLYHLALPSLSNSISLIQLTFDFFKSLNIHEKDPRAPDVEIQHFTDLHRFFQLPPPNKEMLLDRFHEMILPKYSVTQLHEAGVKFKVSSRKCVLDLKFNGGVLEIPRLKFNDSTEAHIRNIMALEQCDYRRETYITDFYLILDHLINTTTDVDLLIEKGVVVNCLGDNNAVISMINNLNRGIFTRNMNKEYYLLCKKLNDHYEEPWHKKKATLRHQYFSNPWRTASTIAAIILLVLTFIQTIFSILQVVKA